jgi:hypothetical protein
MSGKGVKISRCPAAVKERKLTEKATVSRKDMGRRAVSVRYSERP